MAITRDTATQEADDIRNAVKDLTDDWFMATGAVKLEEYNELLLELLTRNPKLDAMLLAIELKSALLYKDADKARELHKLIANLWLRMEPVFESEEFKGKLLTYQNYLHSALFCEETPIGPC